MKANKFNYLLLGLVLVLGLLLKTSVNRYYFEKREKERLYEAFISDRETVKQIETLDKKLAIQTQVLELRTSEIKEIYPELQREIRNLKVKLDRLNSVSQTAFHSEKQITTQIRDSTVFDTLQVRVFDYRDAYYTVRGLALGDVQKLHISMRDTLIQLVYKGKRKHPWWIFSKRQLEQRISLKNPDAKIDYAKIIQVQ